MSLRAVTVLLTIAMTAAACAGGDGAGGGLADGDQTVDEAVAVDEERAAGDAADGGAEEATTPDGRSDDDLGGTDGASGADDGEGVEALWWTAETVDGGEELVAADLAGENVVLWMWAPWCSVCEREAPEVAEALADLPDDVTIIGVAGRDDVEPMREFVAEHGLQDMTHVVDVDGSVWASYGISYQPAWVFIDEDGDAAVAAGAIGYDGLFEGIEQVFRG